MLAHVQSSAVLGIDAYQVTVEVDVSNGMPMMAIVGLPDAAVNESRDRVRTAIRNSGFLFPFDKRVTVNLAPADVRKAGPSFDLPIAIGILLATGQIPMESMEDAVLVGELALDGLVRPVTGALPVAVGARQRKQRRLFLPALNAREAAIVSDIDVFAIDTLTQMATAVAIPDSLRPLPYDPALLAPEVPLFPHDFADVKGHAHVKRAMEVAAAGGHNILLLGPPGSGKTMIARRIPSILPPMSADEALEATKLYSVAGMLNSQQSLINTRPFRSPHHTASTAALVGGGSIPRPGEVSLAHHGVLFLDELPEFSRDALEVLRQPLEDGVVNISRVHASYAYPAQFCLVAAMNPCPCGYLGDLFRACTCSRSAIQKYQKRISGPLLDRIDLHIEVPRLSEEELLQAKPGETSATIRERVCNARRIQAHRFAQPIIEVPNRDGLDDIPHPVDIEPKEEDRPPVSLIPLFCNARMGPRELRNYCAPSESVKNLLRTAIQQLGLSARAYDRLLKVARTIADLSQEPEILPTHIAEAIQYRSLDRKLLGS